MNPAHLRQKSLVASRRSLWKDRRTRYVAEYIGRSSVFSSDRATNETQQEKFARKNHREYLFAFERAAKALFSAR